MSLSTFLGTFRTKTFRRAQGGKVVVSSDSGKPVSKQIGHRFQLASVGIAISQRFKAGPACAILPLAQSPPSFQAARQLGHLQDADTKTGPDPGKGTWTCLAAQPSPPSIGRAFLSQEQDLMRAAQAEQTLTWASSRAGLPCLGIGACLKRRAGPCHHGLWFLSSGNRQLFLLRLAQGHGAPLKD